MRKLIGLIGTYSCLYIGHIMCKISHIKIKGEFYFDKPGIRFKMGYWMAEQYQKYMHWSTKIQDWAKLNHPWRKTQN